MTLRRIGTCSICGGDVFGHRGAYWSVVPPPPDECLNCGAVAKSQSDIIPMVPAAPRRPARIVSTDRTGEWRNI